MHKAFTEVGQSSGEDDDVTGPVKKQLSISEACNDYYYYVHAVLGTALLLLLIKLNWLIYPTLIRHSTSSCKNKMKSCYSLVRKIYLTNQMMKKM